VALLPLLYLAFRGAQVDRPGETRKNQDRFSRKFQDFSVTTNRKNLLIVETSEFITEMNTALKLNSRRLEAE
jgi:hypothetical protein